MKHSYSNVLNLSKLVLKKSILSLSIWIFVLTVITLIVAAAFTNLYSGPEEVLAIAETMKNPAMIAMVGPGYGIDNYTSGAMMAHQMLLFTGLAVAVMAIMFVSKNTRADEESGKLELIRSLPVGRFSNLLSTGIVGFLSFLTMSLLIAFGLYFLKIESIDLEGSLVYGLSLGVIGLFFMAVASIFAQLSENTKGLLGYSLTFLGISYILRGIGDVNSEFLSLISPLGLILRTQTYVNNYWWPIIIMFALSTLIFIIAMYLNSIRDLEAGFIPSKAGKRNASKFLLKPIGFLLKLQRTGLIGWTVTLFVLGISYGAVFGDLEMFFTNNEVLQQMLPEAAGISLAEQFLTILMTIISIFATIPVLISMLKIKSEEKKGRLEQIYAKKVSRNEMLTYHLIISMSLTFATIFFSALGLWLASTSVMSDPISFLNICKSAFIYAPAILFMLGVTVFLIGAFPRATTLTWAYLAYSFIVVYLGNLLQFPEWLAKLSPFGNIPKIPVEELTLTGPIILIIGFVILTSLGFYTYNKRDIKENL